MKKSILGRVGLLALTLTLATTSLMSGTLAKYTTSTRVTGKALVAKWDPSATINSSAAEFNLRDTLTAPAESALTDGKKVVAQKIAPGMGGSIPVVINKGDSEVGIEYEVFISQYTADASASLPPLKLKWSEVVGAAKDLSTIAVNNKEFDMSEQWTSLGKGTIAANAENGSVSNSVTWSWPFINDTDVETGNITDTQAGEAAAEVQLCVKVVMNQMALQ